jgi:hypothetical protein
MAYWITEQTFSRQTILESFDSALVEISLLFLIPSQKNVLTKKADVKNW